MSVVMADRVRLVLLVDEEVREALRAESALSGREMSEIVETLLRENLSDALLQIRQRRQGDKGKGKPPRS